MSISNTERIRAAEDALVRLETDVGTARAVLHTAGDVAETVDTARDVAQRAGGRIRRMLPWVAAGAVVVIVVMVVKRRSAASAVAEQPPEDLPAG